MKNKNYITAIAFYKSLQEKEKYKLVNGLFIVKYLDNDICEFVTHFHKAGIVLGLKKNNIVDKMDGFAFKQKFNPKKSISCNSLGYWRPLNIGWNEAPIDEILK
jgi:hypothetical protein